MKSAVSALILIGAPGSGKSSVLEALATRLEIAGVPHGAIESEELSRGLPLLAGDVWTRQLAEVLRIQREAGRRLFLIAATPETDEELQALLDATGAPTSLVVCLTAPAGLLAERLERREPDRWPGKRGLIEHARELAGSIPALQRIDLRIETDGRDSDDIAGQLEREMRERGLLI
ncbi:MAG: AAA family ATPase [Solirubrobacteraceae bacterium]